MYWLYYGQILKIKFSQLTYFVIVASLWHLSHITSVTSGDRLLQASVEKGWISGRLSWNRCVELKSFISLDPKCLDIFKYYIHVSSWHILIVTYLFIFSPYYINLYVGEKSDIWTNQINDDMTWNEWDLDHYCMIAWSLAELHHISLLPEFLCQLLLLSIFGEIILFIISYHGFFRPFDWPVIFCNLYSISLTQFNFPEMSKKISKND